MLTKMVDGKEVVCTPEEEAAIRAEWAENDIEREVSNAAAKAKADKKASLLTQPNKSVTVQDLIDLGLV